MEKDEEEGIEEYHKELEKEYKKDQKVLDLIKEQVSKDFFQLIKEEMEECGHCCNFEIVDKQEGNFEGEHYNDNKTQTIKVWINQIVNGGYTGDDYQGYVYIELPNKKYLKWFYDMG